AQGRPHLGRHQRDPARDHRQLPLQARPGPLYRVAARSHCQLPVFRDKLTAVHRRRGSAGARPDRIAGAARKPCPALEDGPGATPRIDSIRGGLGSGETAGAMFAVVRPVLPVLVGVALIELALGALSPLVAVQLAARHVTPELIGFVTSAYFIGFLGGTLTGHVVINRVGHIRAFSVFAVVASNAALLHLVFEPPYAWIVLRAFIGYGVAGPFVIVESWLNDKATTQTRGRVFAIYMVVAWAISGIGPLGLNLPDPDGRLLFALIVFFMAAALVPMALTRVGHPEIGHRSQLGIARLYRISPLGVFACFASGMASTSLWGLLAVYTAELGYSNRELSIVLSACTM